MIDTITDHVTFLRQEAAKTAASARSDSTEGGFAATMKIADRFSAVADFLEALPVTPAVAVEG